MFSKFVDNLWRILGFPPETVNERAVKRPQEIIISDDDPDEIMVLEEPLAKRRKISYSNAGSIARNTLWNRLRNYPPRSEVSGSQTENGCQARSFPSGILFNTLCSNKENMTSKKEPFINPFSPLRKRTLDSSSPSSPTSLDPNFRFSPSCTSTIERASLPLSNRKRDFNKLDSFLHRPNSYSGIKKSSTPLMKQHLKPFSKTMDHSFCKKPGILFKKMTTAKDSIRLREKMEFQKMIEMCSPYSSPIDCFNFDIRHRTSSNPRSDTMKRAINSGAIKVERWGEASNASSFCELPHSSYALTEEQKASLNKIKNLMKPASTQEIKKRSTPELIDLASKDDESPEHPKKGLNILKKEDSQDSDDLVITKEIIKPRSRFRSPNSIEMKLESSRFYKPENFSNSQLLKNLEKQKEDIARRAKERSEKLRRETSPSHLSDVAKRLSSINLSYPTEYKEIRLDEEEEVKLPELTHDMLVTIDKAFRGGSPHQVLAEKFNIQVSRKDIHTLSGLNWLNDEVINFYMNLLMERGGKKGLPKVYAFNTFFYPKLSKMGYSSVKRWTKKVDIFSYDLLLAPVHLGVHWCLSTIDLRDRTVRYYDSMLGDNYRCVKELLGYLESEHMDKKKTPYSVTNWKSDIVKDIPQQMNGSDCGMFSCMFAEYLSRNAKITFTQEDMPYFRKRVVYEIVTQKLLQ